MYISELYEMELQYACQRFNNNSPPEFTDQELMSIYLFVMTEQPVLEADISKRDVWQNRPYYGAAIQTLGVQTS